MDFKKFLKNHWLIIIILFFASLVRFWRVGDLTTFAGDQGIDFLIIKRMLIDGEFTLLGPKLGSFSNIAIIYLGPIYYYLIAPFLFFFNFDPIGPAIFIVLLSLLTVVLIYLIGLNFFNKPVAVLASVIFAFSVPIVNESRVALNPNPIPFFSAVLTFSLFKIIIHNSKSLIWPVLFGISSGVLFQLHYLTMSLIFLSIIFILKKRYLGKIIILIMAFLITIAPQILFELRHEFFISKQIIARIQDGGDISSISTFTQNLHRGLELISSLIFYYENFYLGAIIIALMLLLIFQKMKELKKIYLFLIMSILISIFLASIYALDPQLHYFAHVYPILALLISLAIYLLADSLKRFHIKAILIIILILFLTTNFSNLGLNRNEGYTMPEGWNLTGVKNTSKLITKDASDNRTFNIAATLDGDTRARPYRYLVEVYGKKPLGVENYPESDILYLISRDGKNAILDYYVWEVASFKPFNFESEWHIQNGITLYKLTKGNKTL